MFKMAHQKRGIGQAQDHVQHPLPFGTMIETPPPGGMNQSAPSEAVGVSYERAKHGAREGHDVRGSTLSCSNTIAQSGDKKSGVRISVLWIHRHPRSSSCPKGTMPTSGRVNAPRLRTISPYGLRINAKIKKAEQKRNRS